MKNNKLLNYIKRTYDLGCSHSFPIRHFFQATLNLLKTKIYITSTRIDIFGHDDCFVSGIEWRTEHDPYGLTVQDWQRAYVIGHKAYEASEKEQKIA